MRSIQARGRKAPSRPIVLRKARWNCIQCGEIDKEKVTDELYGDLSHRYCNICGADVRYEEPIIHVPRPPRPKRFCFFIKRIDGDIHKPFRKYTRFQEFCLALRIGYFKEAWSLLRGKRGNYIWEGEENNPMPW